jgi:predicted metal-dependent enzyme (double-stranded beta helix superfamily)
LKRREPIGRRAWRSLDYFKELGRSVERRWRARDYDERVFADLAVAALGERPAHAEVDPLEILDWVLGDDEMPQQLDPKAEFGQPPITVYSSSRFVIDVLFWLESTTSIHDHAFSGAFQVLAGGSVHGVWRFTVEDAVSLMFQLGRIELDHMELLARGDTRRITAGRSFIHSLFHLDHPSVTVVMRTHEEQNARPQYEYRLPSLALASFVTDERARRRLQSLSALRAIDPKRFTRQLHAALGELDLPMAFEAIAGLVPVYQGEELEAALAAARRRHGARVDHFAPVLHEHYRQEQIIARRKHIRSAEHRFFLALLLNAPDRRRILELVAARVPGTPPLDTIHRWVAELARMPSPHDPREPNALGVPLDDDGLTLLRHILEDKPLPALMRRLAREFDAADVAAQAPTVAGLYEAWRRHPLFQTLFAGSAA